MFGEFTKIKIAVVLGLSPVHTGD